MPDINNPALAMQPVQQAQQTTNDNQAGQQQNAQSDAPSYANPFASLNKTGTNRFTGEPQYSMTQAQQATTQPAQATTIDTIAAGKNFGDTKAFIETLTSGNAEQAASALTSMMEGVYKQALSDAVKVAESSSANATRQMDNKMEVSRQVDAITKSIEAAMPFASGEAQQPLVKALVGNYMRRGASVPEAITATKSYLIDMANNINNWQTAQQESSAPVLKNMNEQESLNFLFPTKG